MLDENLPTFFLKASKDSVKHNEAFYFTQHGTEPEASYVLKHADPASPQAKNTYAAALFDAHSPDVLYGEVLSKPGWTHPTLSQEEIRKNGGLPPPPQPLFPTEFAIQLYNPDQQVVIRQQTSKWSGTVTYEFSMPQTSFRTPSASSLDRSQDDPGADLATPKINFAWRKEGRIGRDMTCYLTGKSTDITLKKAKKSKEPDIAVALFSGLKEMTIMEPNLYRVEMEDYKGLEVVLLLGAAVIRDMFSSNIRETFHIVDPVRKGSGGLRARKGSSPLEPASTTPPVMTPQPPRQSPVPAQPSFPPDRKPAVQGQYNQPARNQAARPALPPIHTGSQPARPRLDPRAQWEIDAETARLKAQVEAEARELKRKEEANRRARRRAEEEEARKTMQFLEQEERQRSHEEKERRRRQADVDKETERLRKQFGDQSTLLGPGNGNRPQQQQRHSAPLIQQTFPKVPQRTVPAQPTRPSQPGPYLQLPANHRPHASQSSFFSNGLPKPDPQAKMKKKSFWGLRSASEQSTSTLRKKQSSMF